MRYVNRRQLLAGMAASGLFATGAFGQSLQTRPAGRPAIDASRLAVVSDLPGQVSFSLVDPANFRAIQGQAAGAPVPPASTLKAITALYALSQLGPHHRFRTRVIRAGDVLILAGGGDPVLTTDDLATLASQLVEKGQTSPAKFAVWGGALPNIEEIAPGQADYLAYNPAVSGMILNFNRVHLGWRHANGGVQMSVEARASKNSPRAYTITAAPGDQRDLFSYSGDGERESWTVSRSAVGRAGSRWLPVRKPELYAGDVFQTLCRAKGLVLPNPEVISSLPVGDVVASLDSQPLTEILRDMLRYSTNLTAEVVGLHASRAATPEKSAQAMQAWLVAQGQGLDFHLTDHSGLSDDSRVTAQGMAQLLAGPGLASGLPALLKENPLDEDIGADPARAVQVVAKTGTLNFVSNLAGYISHDDGQQWAFAVMCMDGPRHTATSGQELPAGVLTWTRDAQKLQRRILNSWATV